MPTTTHPRMELAPGLLRLRKTFLGLLALKFFSLFQVVTLQGAIGGGEVKSQPCQSGIHKSWCIVRSADSFRLIGCANVFQKGLTKGFRVRLAPVVPDFFRKTRGLNGRVHN